jgi:threonine aldolase
VVIDLRSDTVTVPCSDMRAIFRTAEVGDDGFGEDPSVAALEHHVAKLFGHDGAIFTPSGTMANQIALRLLVSPGDEFIAEECAHILGQQNGAAAIFGLQSRSIRGERGLMEPMDVLEFAREASFGVPTRAVAVELTHNKGGGSIYPIDHLREISGKLRKRGIAFHCDGARIWNAHVATSIPLTEYGGLFDTLAVCFSKGLGAPVGSAVLASGDGVARARWLRHQMGGSMRQSGVLAAAALHGVTNHLADLTEDHRRSRALADWLASEMPGRVITPVETNIVMWEPDQMPADLLVATAHRAGLLCRLAMPGRIRFVFHRDVGDDDLAAAQRILADIRDHAWTGGPRTPGPISAHPS